VVGTNQRAHATVCLSVDFDALSLWLQWGARGARAISRGEFGGRVGAPRLLELFDKHSIPTTWFVPGHTAETYPEVTREITRRGHEVGNHGYLHESFDQLTPERVRETLTRSNRVLLDITGQHPRGFRHPAGDSSGVLFEILVELGFEYDSSLMGDDFFSYWCRGRDVFHDDAPPTFGDKLNLVEIPISFVMNDFHHFEFNYGTPFLIGHDSPDEVEAGWVAQFDYMYKNHADGTLVVTLHPQCIGQGLRLAMLERFIEYCKSRDDVRFATIGAVADEFRSERKAESNVDGERLAGAPGLEST
jgi:peptidoglycan/xylan/chitin deacetylase (PgdA/CDA1 family)